MTKLKGLEKEPDRSLILPGRGWGHILLGALGAASLAVASPVAAQEVRTIQAPAPYEGCNVRNAGGTQYLIVGTFRNGTPVTLLGGYGRGWYRVQVQEITGWMARQCLGL